MSDQTTFGGDVHVQGALSCAEFNAPPGSITAADIEAAANIEATKVVHQHPINYTQATGTAVVAATQLLHISRAIGTILSIEAAVTTLATGGDRTITLDLQKSTAGGAFATVLTAPIVLDTGNTIRVPENGAITTTGLVDGDILLLTVAVAGAAGNQAQGLIVTVNLREEPQ